MQRHDSAQSGEDVKLSVLCRRPQVGGAVWNTSLCLLTSSSCTGFMSSEVLNKTFCLSWLSNITIIVPMVAAERACECMRAWVCTFLCSQLHKWIHVVKVVTENYSCHAYPQTNSTYEPAFFLNTKQKALNLAIML